MAHGQQGDFVIEVDKAFHDATAGAGATTALRIVPGGVDIGVTAQRALALAGGRHQRLDHARQADGCHRFAVVGMRIDKTIGRRVQAQGFRSQATDAFAVHRQSCGACGGNHPQPAFGFQFHQGLGVDGLDFRHHQVRLL